jgi:ElaB/YqjD/DUF883 family membrane-anchored ribosome-binding protein
MKSNVHIDKIKANLNQIVDKLENLNDYNFEGSISEIKEYISDTKREKTALNLNPEEKLSEINDSLKVLTKKIVKRLDNIIEIKESDSKALSSELKNLHNQKKLALYKR